VRRARVEVDSSPDGGVSTGSIARRFGLTNPSRFVAAYGKEFGGQPGETRRQR
jgi:AraC-like DNA-binding protein